MQHIKAILKPIEKEAPHELSATANLIEKEVGFTKRYSRGYWLKKIKEANCSYGTMLGLIKRSKELPKKIPVGGWITNRLKEMKNLST